MTSRWMMRRSKKNRRIKIMTPRLTIRVRSKQNKRSRKVLINRMMNRRRTWMTLKKLLIQMKIKMMYLTRMFLLKSFINQKNILICITNMSLTKNKEKLLKRKIKCRKSIKRTIKEKTINKLLHKRNRMKRAKLKKMFKNKLIEYMKMM